MARHGVVTSLQLVIVSLKQRDHCSQKLEIAALRLRMNDKFHVPALVNVLYTGQS